MKTLKEAADYVYNYIKDYDKEIGEFLDYDNLYDRVKSDLLKKVAILLSDKDIKLYANSKNDEILDKLLYEKLGSKFEILLQDMIQDILNEYVLNN